MKYGKTDREDNIVDSIRKESLKMKVGIITYHGAHNYGSVLQAYALYRAVRSEGHEASIINYRTDRQDNLYRIYTKKPSGVMDVLRNLYSFAYRKKIKIHHEKFAYFLDEYITLSGEQIRSQKDLKQLNEIYDCFLCGSDQIWNPCCDDFDSSYLLNFVDDKNICFSYGPSIATENLDEMWHGLFYNMLKGFSDLSVREKSGSQIVSTVLGREVSTVLDPVFLLNRYDWQEICKPVKKIKDYILCYFIGHIPGMREYATKLSKQEKKPIIVINKNLRDIMLKCEKRYDCGPIDFIALVANASAVCTNSFHAVAFSLIFNKEFHVFVDNKHANSASSRINDLLDDLDMTDRIVNNPRVVLPTMSESDFRFHDKLDFKISASKMYLRHALNKIEKYRKWGNV